MLFTSVASSSFKSVFVHSIMTAGISSNLSVRIEVTITVKNLKIAFLRKTPMKITA